MKRLLALLVVLVLLPSLRAARAGGIGEMIVQRRVAAAVKPYAEALGKAKTLIQQEMNYEKAVGTVIGWVAKSGMTIDNTPACWNIHDSLLVDATWEQWLFILKLTSFPGALKPLEGYRVLKVNLSTGKVDDLGPWSPPPEGYRVQGRGGVTF